MLTLPVAVDVPLRADERGKLRIGTTRVLLELLIHAFKQGDTPEQIVDSYPTLSLADVYAVIAYYLAHQAEVDTYVQLADEQADRVQREVEAAYSPAARALIERLRATREHERRGAGKPRYITTTGATARLPG